MVKVVGSSEVIVLVVASLLSVDLEYIMMAPVMGVKPSKPLTQVSKMVDTVGVPARSIGAAGGTEGGAQSI